MNASIFEEIQDQKLDSVFAGDAVNPDSIVTHNVPLSCTITTFFNNGYICTVTVECMNGSGC
ncbi:plantaricin C family lantibiotic [Nocardiopsis aegyptia]|uniref:Lantibiotic n=1 Tax=Nocardiopsis aegyptia TaxID=220378 RepID=A0A7Z0ENY7_9ACTN|nr:plantaricin C family lantibiotic [Nocardiopsis aegyptia]NYJ35615.1 hypothetical protein [Nocardiopsis aegyptia]